jgi:hypothetical protein
VFKTDSWAPSPEEGRPAIKVEFHMPADQYDRFRQMAVDLDMTGAEFCRRAVIGEMDARELEEIYTPEIKANLATKAEEGK